MPINAGPAGEGVRCIAEWLGATPDRWDAITYNFGMWNIGPDDCNLTKTATGRYRDTALETYIGGLANITATLMQTRAAKSGKVFFVNTNPTADVRECCTSWPHHQEAPPLTPGMLGTHSCYQRTNVYNEAAAMLVSPYNISIIDIFAWTVKRCGQPSDWGYGCDIIPQPNCTSPQAGQACPKGVCHDKRAYCNHTDQNCYNTTNCDACQVHPSTRAGPSGFMSGADWLSIPVTNAVKKACDPDGFSHKTDDGLHPVEVAPWVRGNSTVVRIAPMWGVVRLLDVIGAATVHCSAGTCRQSDRGVGHVPLKADDAAVMADNPPPGTRARGCCGVTDLHMETGACDVLPQDAGGRSGSCARAGVPPSRTKSCALNGNASTGAATLRRDGFASLVVDANASMGSLLTRMLQFDSTSRPQFLFVNVALAAGDGGMTVALLRNGSEMPGFNATEFDRSALAPPGTDDTRLGPLRWNSGDLSALASTPFQLRFVLFGSGSSLFSFWVSGSTCGESGGATAGGGPGLGGAEDLAGRCSQGRRQVSQDAVHGPLSRLRRAEETEVELWPNPARQQVHPLKTDDVAKSQPGDNAGQTPIPFGKSLNQPLKVKTTDDVHRAADAMEIGTLNSSSWWFNVSVDLSFCPLWPKARGPCAVGAAFRSPASNATLSWSLDPVQLLLTRGNTTLRRVSLDTIPHLAASNTSGPHVTTLSFLRRGTYFLLFINGLYASWAPHPFNSW